MEFHCGFAFVMKITFRERAVNPGDDVHNGGGVSKHHMSI